MHGNRQPNRASDFTIPRHQQWRVRLQSAFKKQLKEMFFLDTIINVDEAIYKGEDRSTGDILLHEAQGALQSSIITIGAQIYYGTANSTYGFGGLRSQLSGTVAAGGSTSSTSAYLLWFNEWGVSLDVGKDGDIAMKPWTMQQVAAIPPGCTFNIAALGLTPVFVSMAIE